MWHSSKTPKAPDLKAAQARGKAMNRTPTATANAAVDVYGRIYGISVPVFLQTGTRLVFDRLHAKYPNGTGSPLIDVDTLIAKAEAEGHIWQPNEHGPAPDWYSASRPHTDPKFAPGYGTGTDPTEPAPPVNEVPPTVSGQPEVGSLLTCQPGTWTGNPYPTFTYQWLKGGLPIQDATANTYTTVSGDLDGVITCEVTGTNSEGSDGPIVSSNSITVTLGPPVSTVDPILSGTGVVGSVVTCSTGIWTNSPSGYSYQHKMDGVNVGTDSPNYTLQAGDLGKIATCVVTATNAGGSGTATSNGVEVVAEAVTLTVAEPVVNGFVYGLNTTRTSASVPISGTYTTGAPSSIQARIVTGAGAQVVGWTTIDAAPTGGTFSGSIPVPQQGMTQLRAEVRADANDTTKQAQTGLWSVGIVAVVYGQSNSLNWSRHSDVSGDGSLGTSIQYFAVESEFGWQAKGVVEFCDHFSALVNLPVLSIAGGAGGVPISALMEGTEPMNEMLAAISLHANGVIHAMLWNQGEGNAITVLTPPTGYPGDLNALRDTIATATGQTGSDIPIITCPLMTTGRDDGQQSDAAWTDFKEMQRALPANPTVPNVHIAGSVDDMLRTDTFHSYDGSYEFRARREAAALATLWGAAAVNPFFEISEVEATNATTTTLTVQHGEGNDFTFVALNHTIGQEIPIAGDGTLYNVEVAEDDWTTPIAATGVRTNATTIVLTHAAVGAGTRLVRYMYGRPLGDEAGIAVDNSPYAFPLFWEKSITLPDVTAPTLASSVPANGAAGVSGGAAIALTFDETVVAGTGTFTLRNVTQAANAEVFTPSAGTGNDGGTVTVSGPLVTLTPGSAMTGGETYSVRWTANAVKDASDNPVAANNTDAALSFGILAGAANLFTRDPNLQDAAAWNLISGVTVSGGEMIFDGTQATYTQIPSLAPYDAIEVGKTYDVWQSISDVTVGGRVRLITKAYNASDVFAADVVSHDSNPDLLPGKQYIQRYRFTAAAGQVKFGMASLLTKAGIILTIDEFGLKEVMPGDTNVFYGDPNFENPNLWSVLAGTSVGGGQLVWNTSSFQTLTCAAAHRFPIEADTAYNFVITCSEYTAGSRWIFTALTDSGNVTTSDVIINSTGTFNGTFTSPAGATNTAFSMYPKDASNVVFTELRIEKVV